MTNLFIQIFNVILKFTSDYGIAVILFTLLVKLVLLPFTIKQRKSMKIQQKLTEKMNLLKEKYKDDKDKLNQEMVNLYKENPGCSFSFLLLILQLPVLFAMYNTFAHNIVSTQTIILPWINNLSKPDPYFILPILYVVSQVLPSLLVYLGIIKNSAIPKPSPMTIFPAILIALLVLTKSPAALGIYFIVSNILSSAEQLIPISE